MAAACGVRVRASGIKITLKSGGNRIVAASTPRITAANALHRKPASHESAVETDGLQCISRAARCEATPAQRPK
jgi:hypothetical protein